MKIKGLFCLILLLWYIKYEREFLKLKDCFLFFNSVNIEMLIFFIYMY